MRNIEFRGFYRAALAVALSASLFAAGCSSDDDPSPPESFAPPSNLTFENGDGVVILKWDVSGDESFSEFIGYNVYQSNETMIGLSNDDLAALVVNSSVLPKGTTTRSVTGLTNGDLEYFAVRSVHENGNLSGGTAEVRSASVDEGLVEIMEFAGPNPSAIDLSTGMAVRMINAKRMMVDLYLGTDAAAGDDAETGALVIKSPDLVQSSEDWSSRNALFKELDGPNVSTTATTGFSNQIVLGSLMDDIEDRVFAVKIPADDMAQVHYGKIEILSTDLDTAGQRTISVSFTYQPAVNVPIF